MPEKREWCYLQPPKVFEVAPCECGNHETQWSEFKGHLWCPECQKDFIPLHNGVFDGPIPAELAAMLGLSFDRYIISSGEVEKFDTKQLGWCVQSRKYERQVLARNCLTACAQYLKSEIKMPYNTMLEINTIMNDERSNAKAHKDFLWIVLWVVLIPLAILLIRPKAFYLGLEYGWLMFPLLLVTIGLLMNLLLVSIVKVKRVDDGTLEKLAEVEFQSHTALQALQDKLKEDGYITLDNLERILALESKARNAKIMAAAQENPGVKAILHKIETKAGTGANPHSKTLRKD